MLEVVPGKQGVRCCGGFWRGVEGRFEGLPLLSFVKCVAGPDKAVGGVFDGGDVH